MIGCDTNILVRAVLDDHLEESKIAKQFLKKISSERRLFISSYAILEMVWVLKVMKQSRNNIYEAMLDLLDSPGIIIGQREVVIAALEMYHKGEADFGDYLILAEGKFNDAPHIASFDKPFCKDNNHTKNPNTYL